MNNYDSNPERYEKIDEESYFDNLTNEIVFLVSDEANEDIQAILAELDRKAVND
jgi:hypothetical protein